MRATAHLLSKIKYTRMRRARTDTHASAKKRRETEGTLHRDRQRNTPLMERAPRDWMDLEAITVVFFRFGSVSHVVRAAVNC